MALVAGGTGLLVLAAGMVVSGAEELARSLGVPELVVGLTVVALGTSAPEVATSLVAAARGERDLAVGNVVGSNVLNIVFVLGITATVSAAPVAMADEVLRLDLPIMTAAAVACLPVLAQGHRLERWEGAVFVSYYVAYLVFLGLDAAGHAARDPFAVVMLGFVVPLTVLTAITVAVRRRRRDRHEPGIAPLRAGSPRSGAEVTSP
jgi:cation:H+ antiporter